MKHILTALAFSILPAPALAHPHVFIDAGIAFIFNDAGQLSAIQVQWAYDDFYTMVQLDDMGLDGDGDGIITVKEQEKLVGFDTQWLDGFEGDLAVIFADEKLTLGPPTSATAELSDGRLLTSHIRHLETPLDMANGSIALRAFDPTYYSAYTLDLGAEVLNRDSCMMEQIPADLGKAYDLVENLLYGSNSNAENEYPAVGEHFADTLTLSCEPYS